MTPAVLPIGDPVHLAGPAPMPRVRTLTGPHYELRAVDPDGDVDDLHEESRSGPGADVLFTYMSYGPFDSREHMRAWLSARNAAELPPPFVVVERATARRVGMCSYMAVAPEMRRLEIGHIWYAPRLHGTGINAEVAWLLLREAFETLGYRRVEWKCNALNERSRRAASNLGFTYEGTFRQHMIVKGRSRDTAYFSLLDREWPAARTALEARLGPR